MPVCRAFDKGGGGGGQRRLSAPALGAARHRACVELMGARRGGAGARRVNPCVPKRS